MNTLSPPFPGILSELRGLGERYHTLYMCMYTCMSLSLPVYMYVPRKRQVSDVRFPHGLWEVPPLGTENTLPPPLLRRLYYR